MYTVSGSGSICILYLGQAVCHLCVWVSLYTISGSGSVCRPYLGQLYTSLCTISGSGSVCRLHLGQAVYQSVHHFRVWVSLQTISWSGCISSLVRVLAVHHLSLDWPLYTSSSSTCKMYRNQRSRGDNWQVQDLRHSRAFRDESRCLCEITWFAFFFFFFLKNSQ